MSLLGATSYHPHWAWADPAIKPRAYDVSAATAEFKAAGWVDHDGDGILDKDGRPLQFTLLMNASSREIVRRLVQWMQDAYRDAGIVMKIDVLEWAAFQQRRREHSFEAMLGVFSFTPDPDQLDLYHTDARENGFNYVGFSDPECDRLLEEIRITRDPEERRRKLFELQQLLFEQEPLTNLFHMPTPILRHRDLQGVVPSPLYFLRFHPGPRNWYWTGSDAD
jgi:peptide/nickel transport system substrate-binding protein